MPASPGGYRRLDLSRVAIMGVLNVTPDSFSDGAKYSRPDRALEHARLMAEHGADIIDVGGESTRPGAQAVSVQQELDRVIPVIEVISKQLPVRLSIDTSKHEVMRSAVEAGASLINDVKALQSEDALATVAALEVPVCLMHMQGEPRVMQDNPSYDDVVIEVKDFLARRIEACLEAGIKAENIIIDPGFGFGKTVPHNIALLNRLSELLPLAAPILVGLSRKSMIGKILNLAVDQRVHASVALALLAVQAGARLVRVHDVAATHQAIRMLESVAA